MKKILIYLLTFSILLVNNINVIAADHSNVSSPEIIIIEDNDNFCIVKEVSDENITIATNNKSTGILTIDVYDIYEENLLSTQTINLLELSETFCQSENLMQVQVSLLWLLQDSLLVVWPQVFLSRVAAQL